MLKIYPKKCTKCNKGFSKGIVIDEGNEYYCSEKCCLEQHKEEKVFRFSGEYTFNVRQAMRKNGFSEGLKALKGVTDVGFSIEKTK